MHLPGLSGHQVFMQVAAVLVVYSCGSQEPYEALHCYHVTLKTTMVNNIRQFHPCKEGYCLICRIIVYFIL